MPGRPANGACRGPGPDEGQATMAMRMPASGAPSGQRPDGPRPDLQRPDSPRPEPGYPAGGPADYGTGPERSYGGDSGSYPIDPAYDPLDPAYPVPAARYPDEPATGSYRRPAEEYGPAAGYPADPGYAGGPAARDYRRPETAGYHDLPATGDYRSGQSGSHRRGSGDFPSDPHGPRYGGDPAEPGYHDEDDHGGYHDAGYPDVPGTGDYRTVQSGSHRRPAGGYPGDPSFHPYSGQAGNADYPGEAVADDSGAYPAGPDYGEGDEWDDTADHSVESYDSEPGESFPYGASPRQSRPPGTGTLSRPSLTDSRPGPRRGARAAGHRPPEWRPPRLTLCPSLGVVMVGAPVAGYYCHQRKGGLKWHRRFPSLLPVTTTRN